MSVPSNQIRQTLLGVLDLAVIFGPSMAQACTKLTSVGLIVICTFGGTKIMWIDATGQPKNNRHVCLECVFSFMDFEHARFTLHTHRAIHFPSAAPRVPKLKELI